MERRGPPLTSPSRTTSRLGVSRVGYLALGERRELNLRQSSEVVLTTLCSVRRSPPASLAAESDFSASDGHSDTCSIMSFESEDHIEDEDTVA